jgi:hypothetical protein
MLACIGVIEHSQSMEQCLISKVTELDRGILVQLNIKKYVSKIPRSVDVVLLDKLLDDGEAIQNGLPVRARAGKRYGRL